MTTRFTRLSLGLVLAGSLVVGSSLPAAAVPVDLAVGENIDVNGGVVAPGTGVEPGGALVQVDDKGLLDVLMSCKVDAFDDALTLQFDQGGGFPIAYEAPGGEGDQTETPQGTRITAGAVTAASGIEVSMDLLVFGDLSVPGTAIVRQVYALANPGTAEVTDTFVVRTAYGSDADMTVEASSSGGSVVANDTGWVVTSDAGGTAEGDADPVNLTVHQGPQPTAATPTLENAPGGDPPDLWKVALSVTVPAGETRYLVFFAASYDWCNAEQFTEAVDSAEQYAENFASSAAALSAGLFGGIPEADLPLIANWTFPDPEPDPEPAPSPEPTPAIPRFTG